MQIFIQDLKPLKVQEGQTSLKAFFEAKKNSGVKVEKDAASVETDAASDASDASDAPLSSPDKMIGKSGVSLRKTASHPTWRKEGVSNGVGKEAEVGVVKVEADLEHVKVEVRTIFGVNLGASKVCLSPK